MVSSVQPSEEQINDDHDVHLELLYTSKECEDAVETINSSLPKLAPLSNAETMHTDSKRAPTLEAFLQTQA